MPVVKETLLSSLLAYPDMLIHFLQDPEIKDKTELIKIAADLKLEDATPILIEMIADSTNESNIHLLIETLGLIGDPGPADPGGG